MFAQDCSTAWSLYSINKTCYSDWHLSGFRHNVLKATKNKTDYFSLVHFKLNMLSQYFMNTTPLEIIKICLFYIFIMENETGYCMMLVKWTDESEKRCTKSLQLLTKHQVYIHGQKKTQK